MRLIKMLSLAAIAAMTATAFVGATPASATSTQLCNSHSALTCGSAATSVNVVNSGTGHLLSSLVDVLCDDINGTGTPLALANPQSVHVSGLDFASCETNGGDGCLVEVFEQPLANLLKTGLDSGTITGTNGTMGVICEDIILGHDIYCAYDLTGAQVSVGAQHLTANNTEISYIDTGHDDVCPTESFLDGLLETTANRYVLA